MPVFSSYFINYDLSKCKMLTNLTLLQIQGFAKHKIKKKNQPCSWNTVSKYKLFTFSFFDGVLLSRSQLRNIHRRSLRTARWTLWPAVVREEEYQVLCHCGCAFFPFLFPSSFLKSTFIPLWVLSCFKMLLLQQFLLKHCCCRVYLQPKRGQSALFRHQNRRVSLDTW